MAYPLVPGRRMAWDEDGTVAVANPSLGTPHEMSLSERQLANGDGAAVVSYDTNIDNLDEPKLALLFPELRDIDGAMYNALTGQDRAKDFETSSDTTNGADGTWTKRYTASWGEGTAIDHYRDNIQTLSVAGVRGVRILYSVNTNDQLLHQLHVYGEIASGSTPDRIIILDNTTGLAYTADHDWGSVPRGTVHDEVLDLKNNSATLTANTVACTFEDLGRGSSAWYTIKEAGGGFSTSLSITSIAATVTHGNSVTIRKTIPDTDGLGVHAARMQVAVTSWT